MSDHSTGEPRTPRGVLGLRIAAAVVMVFSAVVLVQAIRIGVEGGFGPEGSGFFPLIIGGGLMFFAVLFLVQTTVRQDSALREHVAEEEEATHWPTIGLLAVALLVYALLLAPLGYVVATTLFFAAATRILGSRRWVRDVLIGLIISVLVYFGFDLFLGVRLPAGVLGVFL